MCKQLGYLRNGLWENANIFKLCRNCERFELLNTRLQSINMLLNKLSKNCSFQNNTGFYAYLYLSHVSQQSWYIHSEHQNM